MVSRFHLALKKIDRDPERKENYSRDFIGFREWCLDLSREYNQDDISYFSEDIVNMGKVLPCHSDFYRYIQWHNYAWSIIRKLDVPFYTLHYEDYSDRFDDTKTEILDFLELPDTGGKHKFFLSDYSEYFTSSERTAAMAFMKNIASNDTWQSISRYMDEEFL